MIVQLLFERLTDLRGFILSVYGPWNVPITQGSSPGLVLHRLAKNKLNLNVLTESEPDLWVRTVLTLPGRDPSGDGVTLEIL